MEKEINIAAILRDKPEEIMLYDLLRGEPVLYDNINRYNNVFCKTIMGNTTYYTENGKHPNTSKDAILILVPSKEMRDWSKFAWKKGDVLVCGVDNLCIFDSWASEDYSKFNAKYDTFNAYSNDVCTTAEYTKVTNENIIKQYIYYIEAIKGGKLNMETLEIEKKPQFKDGDIVVISDDYTKSIAIFKKSCGKEVSTYVELTPNHNNQLCFGNAPYKLGLSVVRMAKEKEKQLLFAALENEGKRWDAEKKAIVDLHKKCEFKPMDWCLMRDFGETWKLCQFGFMEIEPVRDNSPYNAVGGNWYNECIPYNEQTKHLLGTTDDWKGGE